MKNYYQVLGLDPSATAKEIKQAYRELCKLYHPDLNPSADSNARMQEINGACHVLFSPVKKAEYDQLLRLQEQQVKTGMDGASDSGHTTHCRCENCGRVDSTLRVTVFTWVVSLLVMCYRRGWAKILCARCRIKYALLFDLQNFFMGWWSFPFGILWTFEALWHNSMGGQQPAENNALFLAGLGYELYSKGELSAALKALEASLELKDDPRVKAFYYEAKAIFYETAAGPQQQQPSLWQRLATGASHPAIYCAPLIALLFGLCALLFESEKKPAIKARSAVTMQENKSHQETEVADPFAGFVDVTPEEQESVGVQNFEKGEYKFALDWLQGPAMMGRAKAQYYCGRIYREGLGVPKNDPEAAKWFSKAVRRGYLPAYAELAGVLRHSSGVAPNPTERVRLSRIAAERGDANAQLELGFCYRFGAGVPEDEREAEKWHRRAAEQGYAAAQYCLANILFYRAFRLWQNFPERDTKELDIEHYKWAILAMNQGDEGALKNYGYLKDMNSETYKNAVERGVYPEGMRRAVAFVPRRENTNEWLTATESSDGSNEPISSGTGFFISEDGYLITNFHVVGDAMRIGIQCGRNIYTASLVKADPINDLALLKVAGKFMAIPLAASRTAQLGDSVFTVGFPNPQLQGVAPKLTDGKISSLSGAKDDARHFQISVAVQPGNSGGALVNSAGNVIGIVTARLSEEAAFKTSGALPQNVNYAIKSSYVLSLLESMQELAGKVKEPWPAKERKFEDVVKDAQEAAALVLVY